jgi:hypothetical protein
VSVRVLHRGGVAGSVTSPGREILVDLEMSQFGEVPEMNDLILVNDWIFGGPKCDQYQMFERVALVDQKKFHKLLGLKYSSKFFIISCQMKVLRLLMYPRSSPTNSIERGMSK